MSYLYCKENCNEGEGHNKEQHHKNTYDILHGIIHYTVDLNDAVLQTVEVSTLSNNEVDTNITWNIAFAICFAQWSQMVKAINFQMGNLSTKMVNCSFGYT